MKQSKEFETADSSARHVKTLAQALAHKVALDEKELIILLSLLEDASSSHATYDPNRLAEGRVSRRFRHSC